MKDFVIYYQYRKDPRAKVLNICISAVTREKAEELFYTRYPKENYRIVNPE